MGDSEPETGPGLCLACGFCGTTYPERLKCLVLLVEVAEEDLTRPVWWVSWGSVCSSLSLQSLFSPSQCACLETWTLSPKRLQLGFSGEARWPGPGVLELTSSLLSLPLFSYSSGTSDWRLSRLCAQGPGCGWKLGKETPAHGPLHYLKLGLLLSLWPWFDLWVKLYVQRETGWPPGRLLSRAARSCDRHLLGTCSVRGTRRGEATWW